MPTEPFHILLTEDNPGDARLVQEAFKTTEKETEVHIVTDGDEALDFLLQRNTYENASWPDLALLDLNLPKRDGCEVLNTIREEEPLQHLPVIMLTSSEDSEDIKRCYESNANAYLTKPTEPAAFYSLMNTVQRFWLETAQLPPTSA